MHFTKYYIRAIVCLISVLPLQFVYAQQAAGIQPLRYNDDFSYLKKDSAKKGLLRLKYIPIANNTYLSIGGEIREQLMYYKNIGFGEVPPTYQTASTWQGLQRLMLHSNFEAGKYVRFFTQVYSTSRFFNPNPAITIDQNAFALHQAFVDIKPAKNFIVRAGRQEYSFGKERFIATREGPNNRQSFDGLTFKLVSAKLKADAYFAKPILLEKGAFDDKESPEYLTGVYSTFTAVPKSMLFDVYYHFFNSPSRSYNNYTSGTENRNSLGFRTYSANKFLNYELESSYQWGTFAAKSISAYSIAYDLNYLHGKFLGGLAGNIATGDKDPSDNKINTFNTLFGRPPFGQAAGQGLTNVINYNPYLRYLVNTRLNIQAGASFLSRHSVKDGIYNNAMRIIRPQKDKLLLYDARKIGQVYTLDFNYKANNNLTASIQGATYAANDFIRQSGKSNQVYFFSIRSAYKF